MKIATLMMVMKMSEVHFEPDLTGEYGLSEYAFTSIGQDVHSGPNEQPWLLDESCTIDIDEKTSLGKGVCGKYNKKTRNIFNFIHYK